jgi:hypothetical protein
MISSCNMICRELSCEPMLIVNHRPYIQRTRRIEHVIEVGIKGKVYMKDRYLPRIGEKLGELLEKYHWKFGNSFETRCFIRYYISPDWEYWIFSKE